MEAGKSKVKVPAGLFFGGVSLLGLPTAASSLCPHRDFPQCLLVCGGGRGGDKFSGVSYRDTNPIR